MNDNNEIIAIFTIILTIVYVLGVCMYYLIWGNPEAQIQETYLREWLSCGIVIPVIGLILTRNKHEQK